MLRSGAALNGEIVGTFALAVMDNLARLGAPSGLIEDVVVRALAFFWPRPCSTQGAPS